MKVIDKISKYMSETLLMGEYSNKEELISKLKVNIKLILYMCLIEMIYYLIRVAYTGETHFIDPTFCLTICIISSLRCLLLLYHLSKK
ncbi:hypothetical protein CHF27_013180 [Romboutsia maritimum]|uniref:Uncharacterized protein n=1 Tax=Romboutsia maritimum TaxID=2020948 RepID=A0A371IPS1_9FIRM|nr:hypothetical protein [Romboutsia maritimum]RDY22478.1 hypothetical protein CHF27_013180 [Romboutsia maritimum]